MMPKRKSFQKCMYLSLDPMEDLELKRQEIRKKYESNNKEKGFEELIEENSALQRLDEKGLDLTAYVAAEDDSV